MIKYIPRQPEAEQFTSTLNVTPNTQNSNTSTIAGISKEYASLSNEIN